MDGYAVRLADIASGHRCPLPGNRLPVSRIMVNGLGHLHSYYDRCAGAGSLRSGGMQEQTEQTDNGVRFTVEVRTGKIFAVAVKISLRVRLFSRGNSPDYRRAASNCFTGDCRSPVIRKVRVALFSTGDELQLQASRWATAKSTIPTVSPYT